MGEGVGDGPRTAFVLGGGGNLGAVQVGMLRAVLEHGIAPDVVVGCSVGAINGAALAVDPTIEAIDRMATMWQSLDTDALFPPGRLSQLRLVSRRSTGLVSNAALRTVVEAGIDARRFEDTKVPLHVVATSLRSGREVWFSRGPLIEPVLASAALPAVLPPVAIGDEWLIDGGVVDNVPIGRAIDMGTTRIVVFHVGNFDKPRPLPKRPLDVLLQAFSIARNHRFVRDLDVVPPDVELIVLPGVDPGNLRYNDFRRSAELIERGYESSAMALRDREPAGEVHRLAHTRDRRQPSDAEGAGHRGDARPGRRQALLDLARHRHR
jgi:NTE family protein